MDIINILLEAMNQYLQAVPSFFTSWQLKMASTLYSRNSVHIGLPARLVLHSRRRKSLAKVLNCIIGRIAGRD